MTDLRAFTRDLARQMEVDLGTRLDWVAVDHWNTDNPHVHLLVRGVDRDRRRSRDLARLHQPGPALARRGTGRRSNSGQSPSTKSAMRWRAKSRPSAGRGSTSRSAWPPTKPAHIDLRPENPGAADPEIRRLMIGRLQHLEKMGLAAPAGAGEWMVGLEAERNLRDLGMRGDIIKTMHRAFTERGEARGVADYVIESETADVADHRPAGRRGLHDELTGEAYAVIDGTDGRAHHVRFRGIEAFEHAPPIGGIVEVRRFGRAGRSAARRWCSRTAPISTSLSRSPHRARPGSTTGWSSAIRCRSPWAGSAARPATPWKLAPNIWFRRRSRTAAGTAHHPAARPPEHAAPTRTRRGGNKARRPTRACRT